MILYIFFILLDYEQIAEGWVTLVPVRYRKSTVRLMNDVKVSMNQYFRGQSLVAFCVGILFCIGFLIIDFPLAIPLGLFIGLLNMVPYLQIVGFIPTILLATLKAADTGESFWWIFCMALLVFAIVQMIQDGFLVPKIMGRITGLNPAIILLSPIHLGITDGNAGNDYRTSSDNPATFLLSTLHTQERPGFSLTR